MSEQPHAIVERDMARPNDHVKLGRGANALSPEMMEIMSGTWDEVNRMRIFGVAASLARAARLVRARI